MEVTISGNLITIVKDDGTEQVINGLNVVDEGGIRWQQYNTVPPLQTSDAFTQPTPTNVTRYKVVLHFNDNRWEEIKMGDVTNQPSWTDDLTGVNEAVDDLSAALVVSGGGGGGSVDSVDADAPLSSTGGSNPTISFVGPIGSGDVTDDSTIGGGTQDLTATLDLIADILSNLPGGTISDVNGQTGPTVTLDSTNLPTDDGWLYVTIAGVLEQELFRTQDSGNSYQQVSDPDNSMIGTSGFWRVFQGATFYVSNAPDSGPPSATTQWENAGIFPGSVSREYSGSTQDVLEQLGEELAVQASAQPQYYKAVLTQTGTDAPVVTVLHNNTGWTIGWAYDDVGLYSYFGDGGAGQPEVTPSAVLEIGTGLRAIMNITTGVLRVVDPAGAGVNSVPGDGNVTIVTITKP